VTYGHDEAMRDLDLVAIAPISYTQEIPQKYRDAFSRVAAYIERLEGERNCEVDCTGCGHKIPASECPVLPINKRHMAERDEARAERDALMPLYEAVGRCMNYDWPPLPCDIRNVYNHAREVMAKGEPK
jgi:hypothetical protein